jgi:hypothetical protein
MCTAFYFFMPIYAMTKLAILSMMIMMITISTSSAAESTICTTDYTPVCAEVQVQCIAAPCFPIPQTFGNACMAQAAWAEILFEWDCNIAQWWVIDPTASDMVTWAHQLGITKYDNTVAFKYDDLVTREQAAKMIMKTIDASWVEEWMIKQSAWSCVWTDTDLIDSSLLPMVKRSCSKWLFRWSNGKFMPKAYLTDTDLRTVTSRAAQFIPALMDILMRSKFAAPKDAPLTRGELITALHNLYQQIAPVVVIDPPALPVVVWLSWEYYLASYDGTWVSNTGITLSFSGSRILMHICNIINVDYVATMDSITFSSRISTKIACIDDFAGKVENEFAIIESASYIQDRNSIIFTTKDNHIWIWKKK